MDPETAALFREQLKQCELKEEDFYEYLRERGFKTAAELEELKLQKEGAASSNTDEGAANELPRISAESSSPDDTSTAKLDSPLLSSKEPPSSGPVPSSSPAPTTRKPKEARPLSPLFESPPRRKKMKRTVTETKPNVGDEGGSASESAEVLMNSIERPDISIRKRPQLGNASTVPVTTTQGVDSSVNRPTHLSASMSSVSLAPAGSMLLDKVTSMVSKNAQKVSHSRVLKTNPTAPAPMHSPSANSLRSSTSTSGNIRPAKDTKQKVPRRAGTTAISTTALPTGKTVPKKKLSPQETAVELTEEWRQKRENSTAPPSSKSALRGLHVFYCSLEESFTSPSTLKRMTLLLRHGASLVPVFDANVVTHIVISGRDCSLGKVAAKAGYKKTSDVPLSIPSLTWDWIADGISFGKMPEFWDAGGKYIAFPERFQRDSKRDTSVANARSAIAKKAQTNLERRKSKNLDYDSDSGEESRYRLENTSKATVVSGTPIVPEAISGTEHGVSVQCDKDDPLAEFYEAAAAEHFERGSLESEFEGDSSDVTDDQVSDFHEREARESDDEDSDPGPSKSAKVFAAARRRFTCDNPHPGPIGGCPNQDIVDQLSILLDLVKCQPGPEPRQRAYTYSRAISSLRAHPKRIKSFEDAKRLPGVGERTASKIMEIIQTGGLERIKHENSESVQVVKLFQGIYGVGQNTAQMWYNNGCRTLEDLKTNPRIVLSDAQKIGIQFYDDINDRMPRAEAGALFELIKPIALSIDPALFVEIMGSYRRGKADCGDIDILISRDPSDGRTHEGILQELLERLEQAGIVTEHLALPGDFEDLENCYRGLCRLPNVAGSKRRRIDFLTVPWKNKGGALLYYTGDDIFNRSMRFKASTMGFSLNQRGLSAGVVRDPSRRSIKLNKGNIVASETEEEIFKMLNIKYRPPHERVTHFK